MLLKNTIVTIFYLFTNYIYVCTYVYFIISILFLLSLYLRIKFIFFLLNLYFIAIFGTYIYLDGFFFILIITEVTLVLLFLVTYTQLYSSLSYSFSNRSYYSLSFIFLLFCSKYQQLSLIYFSYFDYIYYIKSNDFFIFFYFFFIKFYLITIILILIISFFSVYFILLFFFLKTLSVSFFKHNKIVKLLRKQNLIKQNVFINKLRFFQNT